MEFAILRKRAKKLAGRAFAIINRRRNGSYLFLNDAMTSIHAIENREANMQKIVTMKATKTIIGYYGRGASRRSLERDIFKAISVEKHKPV